jgi:hypothetical protein
MNKHNMPVALYQSLTDAGVKEDKAEKAVKEVDMYISETVMQAVQPIVTEMRAEFKFVHARIDSEFKVVHTEIASVRNELRTEVKALHSKLNWVFVLIPLMVIVSTAISVMAPHFINK